MLSQKDTPFFFKMSKRCTEECRFSDEFIFFSYNFPFQQQQKKMKREELKVNNLSLIHI